jgi:hypothetical protein
MKIDEPKERKKERERKVATLLSGAKYTHPQSSFT